MEADVIIIGCGPAGLQAAIHSSRNKAKTVVVGKPGNSALSGTEIENYLGVGPSKGDDIIASGMRQAEGFGAEFIAQNVMSSGRDGDLFRFALEDGTDICARSVIIATGVSRRKLGVPGEDRLYGKGVSYCAICDCNFYKGKRVVIVGDESEAASSAILMRSYASEVSWVHSPSVTANKALVDKVESDPEIKIFSTVPASINGDSRVESVTLEDGTMIPTDGVFIELGAKSAADIAMDIDVMPEMDDSIKVDQDCRTEVPGVFACGDITGKPYQLAKAVGQGCVAGIRASEYAKGSR